MNSTRERTDTQPATILFPDKPAERTTTYKIRRSYNGSDDAECGIPVRLQIVESKANTPFREGTY